MATDGPRTPESAATTPPTGEQKPGLFARLKGRGKEAKPASPPPAAATPQKEATLNKAQSLMEGLKTRNKELDENVLAEFGQGENQFLALKMAAANIGEREGTYDYLIVSKDGPMILRTKANPLVSAQEFYHDQVPKSIDPNKPIISNRGMTPRLMRNIIDRYTHRDGKDPAYLPYDSKLREQILEELKQKSGESGYTKDKGTLTLNFAGKKLVFLESPYAKGTAWLQNINEVKQAESGHYGDPGETSNEDARTLQRLGEDAAKLVLQPEGQDVARIIEANIKYAKGRQGEKEAEKTRAELKRIEDENATRAKAQEDADTVRRQEAERLAKKDQATDAALEALGKF